MSRSKCPSCENEAECIHLGDMGRFGIDYEYEDMYALRCAHCMHYEERTQQVSDPYRCYGKTSCPFCG